VAIITGASGGIGKVAAVMFAKEGAKVVIASRNVEAGKETVSTIKESGGEATFVRTDVSKAADAQNMVGITVNTYKKLDILYNNAAIVGQHSPTVDVTEATWDEVVATNLKGTWLGMKYAIPEMLKGGGGVIINVASLAAHVGVPGQLVYSATKGGIISMSRVVTVEYAPKNIRVNCISPGPTLTPMLIGAFGEEGARRLGNLTAKGRLGEMEEVARVALFLASDESSHMMGQTVYVDGGHIANSHIGW
jgi:NAD(P)-dependent dehydrogenase (short-subunit alcohol dehydrogenase family)